MDDEWISTREAAALAGVSYSAYRSAVWRSPLLRAARRGDPPPGDTVYWHRPTVEEWRDTRPGRGNRTNHYEGPVSEWPRADRKKAT